MAIAFDANLGTVTDAASLTISNDAVINSRVFLFLAWYDNLADLTGVSGGGLDWVVDALVEGGSGVNVSIASADAPDGLSESTVITPAFDQAPAFGPGLAAASFTGLETGMSGYLDDTSTINSDATETWVTNDLITTNADDLLVAISTQADRTASAPTSPAIEIHQWVGEGNNTVATVYRIVASTGTYTLGGTWSGGTAVFIQDNVGAAYKGISVPPPPAPTLMVTRAAMRQA